MESELKNCKNDKELRNNKKLKKAHKVDQMNCCVIVLNYNDYLTTLHFVEHILNYKSIDRIVVIDNSSTDESYSKLRKKFYNFEKIDLITTSRNCGYSYGNNFGFRYAINKYSPKYFFISNPDVIVSEETIEAIINFYVKQSKLGKVGIISTKMISRGKEAISAWKLPILKDDIILSVGVLEKFFGNPTLYSKDFLSSEDSIRVDVIQGSFFFISSEAIIDVSFFDENVFLYCEERIIAYKLKEKGYQNYLLTNFSFIHKGGTSILKSIQSYLKRYFILQNSKKYYHTYYVKTSKVGILLLFFVTYIGAFEIIIWQFLKQLFNVFVREIKRRR